MSMAWPTIAVGKFSHALDPRRSIVQAVSGSALLGLAPWIAMVLAVRSTGIGFVPAALLATFVAIGVGVHARRRGLSAEFEGLSALIFLAMVVAALFATHHVLVDLAHYGRAIAAGAMAIVMLVSLSARPLTQEYTRQLVPRQALLSKGFGRLNRVDTLAWGITAAAVALSFVAGAMVHNSVERTTLNWLLPVVLAACGGTYIARRWTALDDLDEVASSMTAAFDLRVHIGRPDREPDLHRRPMLQLISGARDERPTGS